VLTTGLEMGGGDDPGSGGDPGSGDDPGSGGDPGSGHGPPGEPDPETLEMLARFEKNMEFFLGYEVPPFAGYVPDLASLRSAPVRVEPAVGAESKGEPPYRAAFAVAERLGTSPVVFPGDHGGFGTDPVAFGDTLRRVLSRS
jgi:hypothetical protein